MAPLAEVDRSGAPSAAPAHRADIDWLRILATYLLFAFHAAKVYDVRPFYHVKNTVLAEELGYFTGFIHLWHMPLFFVLAGWSALGSLRMRRVARFVRERIAKLLVPLVFGMIAVGPFLRWAELRTGQFVTIDGRPEPAMPGVGFLEYVPYYFTNLGHVTWGHLWFLAYLLTFTLLVTPLLAVIARWPLSELSAPRWLVYAPILPLAVVQATLRDRWPGFQNLVDDWANFSYYLLFFLLGAALAHAPGFERSVHREARPAGAVALVAALAMVACEGLKARGVAGASTLFWTLSAIAGWCAVIACLGFASERLTFTNRAFRWLSESAYPVYFLHQVGVVAAALVVIELPLGIPAKLVLTIALAVALTLPFYQLVVRPFAPLRFLLGMKPRPKSAMPRSETLGSRSPPRRAVG